MNQLSNDDYYFLPDGRLVFTEQYHLRRGYCCGSGCKHCPYDFANVPEPKRSTLISQKLKDGKNRPG